MIDKKEATETVISALNMIRAGKNWKCRCPFHNEITPSFTVNPAKDFYHCFGCGATGETATLILRLANTKMHKSWMEIDFAFHEDKELNRA